MRKLRDLFYISGNFQERFFLYYGMEFHEFIKHNPIPIENILHTDSYSSGYGYNINLGMNTTNGNEEILELSQEDLYHQGDFHWMDYEGEEGLNQCTPLEMSEILYLSHFGKPLNTPFFHKMNNNFVYLAHDDGWFCKLYCKDMSIFKEVIANKIIASFSTNKRRKIYPMAEEVKDELLELTKKGLLIDFTNIIKDNKWISMNIYAIGHYSDMDKMYNNHKRLMEKAEVKGCIIHRNKEWKIDLWNK